MFPQQFRDYFQRHGIDIDQHTVSLGENNYLIGVHGRGLGDMPGRWNQRWQQFINQNPNATSKDVYQQPGRMMDEFGMNDLSIKPYGQ